MFQTNAGSRVGLTPVSSALGRAGVQLLFMCWIAAKRRAAPNQPGGGNAPPHPPRHRIQWFWPPARRAKGVLGLRPAGGVAVAGPRTGLTTSTDSRGCRRSPLPPRLSQFRFSRASGDAARRRAAQRRGQRRHAGAKWSANRGPHSKPTSRGPRRAATPAPQTRRLAACFRVSHFGHRAHPGRSPSASLQIHMQAGHS